MYYTPCWWPRWQLPTLLSALNYFPPVWWKYYIYLITFTKNITLFMEYLLYHTELISMLWLWHRQHRLGYTVMVKFVCKVGDRTIISLYTEINATPTGQRCVSRGQHDQSSNVAVETIIPAQVCAVNGKPEGKADNHDIDRSMEWLAKNSASLHWSNYRKL